MMVFLGQWYLFACAVTVSRSISSTLLCLFLDLEGTGFQTINPWEKKSVHPCE